MRRHRDVIDDDGQVRDGLRALRRCDGSTTVALRDIGDSLCACAVREDPAENAVVDSVDTCMNARSHSTKRVKVI